MAVLPEGIPLESCAGLVQQFRGHRQVDLRGRQMGVAEVHREVVQEPLHVRPLPIPLRQPVDRERVPKVVQPGLVAGILGPTDLGVFAESLEGVLQRVQGDRCTPFAEEESAVVTGRRILLGPPAGVLGPGRPSVAGRSGPAGT